MEYTTLGDSGLRVSRICLGCMGLALDSSGWREWTLDEAASRRIVDRAIELGVTFFDTANVYSHGDSERVLGRALEGYDRDRLVVATKVNHDMDPANPNARGLGRKAIEQELAASLDRLGLDTVDLYQIHRWDPETPITETLRALDDQVRAGRVRYLGASSMWAHQLADAVHAGERLGLERFVSMQNHYNLVYREGERELIPFCRAAGLGLIPYSPLARGDLARPPDAAGETARQGDDDKRHRMPYRDGGGPAIIERVEEVAADKGVSMAQVSLAWLLHRDPVDAPIVGVTALDHLEAAVEALDVSLSRDDLEYLEAPYRPVEVAW